MQGMQRESAQIICYFVRIQNVNARTSTLSPKISAVNSSRGSIFRDCYSRCVSGSTGEGKFRRLATVFSAERMLAIVLPGYDAFQ